MKRRILPLFLALLLALPPHLLYAGSNFAVNKSSQKESPAANQKTVQPTKNASKSSTDAENAMSAEVDFYCGNYENSEKNLTALKTKHDRNYALWSNELGSLYLAENKNKEARDSLTEAYLIMNSFDAFKNLESKALGLTGNEAAKAYKGDPYEKVMNSFYLGLLLIDENDLDNASACFKNGILCDSDVENNLYKSDFAPLYFLAARCATTAGDKSTANDYLERAKEAFYMSYGTNRLLVWEEQILRNTLTDKQKELEEISSASAKVKELNKKQQKKVEDLKSEIASLESQIQAKVSERQENNKVITLPNFDNLMNLQNNVILCIESGKAPLKVQIGQYGEKAIFRIKPYKSKRFCVVIDDKTRKEGFCILNNNDLMYQAETRGGRKMDGILKGRAQFKQTTAQISTAFAGMAAVAATAAAFSNGNNSNAALIVAGGFLLASLIVGAASAAANPAADARHWSYLPAEIQLVPMRMSPGKHHIVILPFDESGKPLDNQKLESDIEVKDNGTTVAFKRVFERI
jgi:hypothetical protein